MRDGSVLTDTFDREKVIDCMFDSVTSELLAELENGTKDVTYLSEKHSISEQEIQQKFSYLIEHGFILEKKENGKLSFTANGEKLTTIIENDQFDGAIDGLTKMDSYLN